MAFPTGYTKYQEVTIDNTKVSADVTDFVVYIDLSDLVKAGADIFDTCRTDGGDIRITKTDGTTELAREVVTIDTTGKTGEVHVKFTGTLSSSTDTVIRVWYNGTDTEPSASATYGSENVWTDYEGVWHMKEASGIRYDSTANANDLTAGGTVTSATGQIGDGADLDEGSSEDLYITDVNQTNLDISGDYTFMGWFKVATLASTTGRQGIFGKSESSGNQRGYSLAFEDTNKLNARQYQNGTTSPNVAYVTDSAFFTGGDVGTPVHVASRFDVSVTSNAIFKNGSAVAGTKSTAGSLTSITNSTAPFEIGDYNSGSEFDGVADECRIASKDLGIDYIGVTYENQNAPSTFYATSDEETSSSGTDYSMTASVGSFILTGVASTLTKAVQISAEVGAFILTGIDVTYMTGKGMVASVGEFILTGNNASFSKAVSMVAGVGSFTLTGVAVTLTYVQATLTLVAEAGSFVLTGISAILRPSNIWRNTSEKNNADWDNQSKS